jgi:hypothetical protein
MRWTSRSPPVAAFPDRLEAAQDSLCFHRSLAMETPDFSQGEEIAALRSCGGVSRQHKQGDVIG